MSRAQRPARPVTWWSGALLALLALFPAGCSGVFASAAALDRSVSVGAFNQGALLRGVELPWEGPGYAIPSVLRPRGARFATAEVATWLTSSFAAAAEREPGLRVPLGDVSRRRGGEAPGHRSHESGRDVDIFFLAVDEDGGRTFFPEQWMVRFGPDGWARSWSVPIGAAALPRVRVPRVRFDARGNWAVVRSLLTNAVAEVQWIFIHRSLQQLLLEEGERAGDEPELLSRAAAVFQQPAGVEPHDDHMHVRVYCDPGDRAFGCADRGPQRWWKKRWKYMQPADPGPGDAPLVSFDDGE